MRSANNYLSPIEFEKKMCMIYGYHIREKYVRIMERLIMKIEIEEDYESALVGMKK